MPSRRVANTKRVDLSDIADGWNGCYAIVTKASLDDWQKFSAVNTTDLTNLQALKQAADFVKPHFVSGKIKVLDDNDAPVLADMTADDIVSDVDVVGALFSVIAGVAPDPKGSETMPETSSTEPLPSDTSSTNPQ